MSPAAVIAAANGSASSSADAGSSARAVGQPSARRAVDRAACAGRADAVEELQHPKPRHLVRRAVHEAKDGEEVLDVRSLEIAQPAVFDERDPPARQLELERVGVMAGAGEHGLLAQEHPVLARGQDAVADLGRLMQLVAAVHERRPRPTVARRPQDLREAIRILPCDGVRDIEQRLRRPVVALQRHRRRAREAVGELEDVARRCRAERIDRLKVVADRGHGAPPPSEALHDRDLQPVDVLVLVNEDVVKRRRNVRARMRVRHQRPPQEQQVIEIDGAEGALARGEGLKERAEDLEVLLAPREALGHDLPHRPLRVHRARVDVSERVLAREAPSGLAVTLLLPHEIEQVGGITRVEHREVRAESERRGVPAHEAMPHRVERTAEHAPSRAAGHRLRAREHVPRRTARERQQQDPLGRGAVGDERRDARTKRRRLPGPRAGQHEQVAVAVQCGGALLGVQFLEPVGGVGGVSRGEHPFAERYGRLRTTLGRPTSRGAHTGPSSVPADRWDGEHIAEPSGSLLLVVVGALTLAVAGPHESVRFGHASRSPEPSHAPSQRSPRRRNPARNDFRGQRNRAEQLDARHRHR